MATESRNKEASVGKISKSTLENESRTSRLESLPLDIHQNILSRLPVFSLVSCKLVSRSLSSIPFDQLFTALHLSNAWKDDSCLIFYAETDFRQSLHFSDISARATSNTFSVKKISIPSESPIFRLVGSCNGYLCLFTSDRTFLYNPFTKHCIELPMSMTSKSHHMWPNAYGFGFHAIKGENKVMKIYKIHRHSRDGAYSISPHIEVLTVGASHWRTFEIPQYSFQGERSGVLVNESLHWLIMSVKPERKGSLEILALDIGSEKLREVPVPDDGSLDKCTHLVALRGCLSAVVNRTHYIMEIWVMKKYGVKESWSKEFVIEYPNRLKSIRVVCLLNYGKILFQKKRKTLSCYISCSKEFKPIWFQGLPRKFQAFSHFGSLSCIETSDNSKACSSPCDPEVGAVQCFASYAALQTQGLGK